MDSNVTSFNAKSARGSLFARIGQLAAGIAANRYSYGNGRRRKAVQVSSIPEIDGFEEKSKLISKAMGLYGRSSGAILAVDVLCEILGIGVENETDN